MKNLFFILMLVFSAAAIAQLGTDAPWMQELLASKNGITPTYEEIKTAGENYWQSHDKEAKGSGYKPFMRWVSRAEAYVKADGTIQTPEDIQNELNKNVAKNSLIDNSNWLPAGPFSFTETGSWSPGQGRVNTLVVDPNNINVYYIGTPGGGVWKSVDAGVNWIPLTDFLPEIGASAIAVDKNNSNIVYIGTGDDDGGDTRGIGLLKSTDGGATFNTTGLTFNNGRHISEIYIDPTDSNTLLISSNNGFYRSTDGGNTVTRTLNRNVKDIKLKPGDPNTIYLATNDQFYKSTNKGITWTQITSGLPFNQGRTVIGVTPANANYVYLLIVDSNNDLVGVYRSQDSGNSFIKRDSGVDILESSQAWFDLALEVSPTNPETIYTGCLNVWKSTNGGSSFIKLNSWSNSSQPTYTHADIHQIRQFGNELFALTDGGVYRSTNDAGSFTDLTATAQIGQFYRVSVARQSSAEIAGGLQDNGGYSRTGAAWKNYYGADGMESGIDPNDPNRRYGLIQRGGRLYFTINGGNSRSSSISGPEQGNWITPMQTDSQGNIYVGYNSLYKVVGNSFVAISPSFGSNIDVLKIDPNIDSIIYLAVDNILYKSVDAGATFLNMFSFPEHITTIEVNANDSSIIYAATRYSNGRVYKSNNQGISFTDITGNLPNLGKNTLAHQGLSVDEPLYVGTTVGVYRLNNSTGAWERFANNLPNVNVRDLEINTNDNTLTAATYGRGIWQTAVQSAAPNTDIDLVALVNNGGGVSCSSNTIDLIVQNTGLSNISSVDVSYRINRGAAVNQQFAVNINPQNQSILTLTGLNLTVGANDIVINVTTPNDYYSLNNIRSLQVLGNTSGLTNDLHQFENRAFLTAVQGSTASSWQMGQAAGALLNAAVAGVSNVYATNLSGDYGNNSTSYLYSGCYDLSSINSPVLSFDMAFDIESNYDVLYIEYSIDGGTTWGILGNAASANWYNSSFSNCTLCTGAQWTGTVATLNNYNLSLGQLNNPAQVTFRFVLKTDQSVTNEGAIIDNFIITGTLSNNDTATLEDLFSIYPNPSTGIFNISWKTADSFDYDVYDVSGKKIASRINNTGATHQVDLSHVAQGMYFIQIATKTGSVTKKLLVK
jgi:hypothetical protein